MGWLSQAEAKVEENDRADHDETIGTIQRPERSTAATSSRRERAIGRPGT